jgi:hypothetical protein
LAGKTAKEAATAPIHRPCHRCSILQNPGKTSVLVVLPPVVALLGTVKKDQLCKVLKCKSPLENFQWLVFAIWLGLALVHFEKKWLLSQSDVANEFSIFSNCIKISRKTVQMESLVETNFTKCI